MKRSLVVVSFAGGGGSCQGVKQALGRSPDIAINHSAKAIAMHRVNHPETRHYREDVFHVDPREACGDDDVDLAWFSPDCRHFSKSKGSKPLDKKIRGLAWVVIKWARVVKPRVIILENVEEFLDWGPLDEERQPIKAKRGHTFNQWLGKLKAQGYAVEWRKLVAADYGAPTTRKRLFIIARCDGEPITWPEPTHGTGCAKPWRTAAEIIDWSLPFKSIFKRRKPLAENTLARIAHGIHRYVLGVRHPFVVNGYAPTMIHSGNGEREGQAPRVYDIHKPVGTVVAQGVKHALIAAFITKHYGGVVGHELDRPLGTVTTQDHHALTTTAMEVGDHEADADALLDRFAKPRAPTLFDVLDEKPKRTRIYDIGHRMLSPRELFRAQGFPESWRIDIEHEGKMLGATDLVALAGNSVCPDVAAALVRANVRSAMAEAAE